MPDELQMSYAYIFVMFLECFEDLLDDLDDEDFLDEALLVWNNNNVLENAFLSQKVDMNQGMI